jgi:hypothetical protein
VLCDWQVLLLWHGVVLLLQVMLAQNLTAAFWKYSGMAEGGEGEDDDGDDVGECLCVDKWYFAEKVFCV